jgi:hypothetical protein
LPSEESTTSSPGTKMSAFTSDLTTVMLDRDPDSQDSPTDSTRLRKGEEEPSGNTSTPSANDADEWSVQLVDSVSGVISAVEQIYAAFETTPKAQKRVAVDLEGTELCRDGHVALMQVAVEEPLWKIYLFDISQLGKEAFHCESGNSKSNNTTSILPDGHASSENTNNTENKNTENKHPNNTKNPANRLGHLLQDKTVQKFLFDCRADADALYHLCNTELNNVVDAQVYFTLRFMPKRVKNLTGLSHVLNRYFDLEGVDQKERDKVKAIKDKGVRLFSPKEGGSYALWDKRPLLPDLCEYSSIQNVEFSESTC